MVKIHKLVRSKRRTLSLIVETDGSITVRAPMHMNDVDIRNFVEKKRNWINQKQAETRKNVSPAHKFVDGERFLYLGDEVTLRIIPDCKSALVMDGEFKLAKSEQFKAAAVFEAWYKKEARKVFTERVNYYATSYDFHFSKVRISSAKTRWGSCSPKKTLSFTWRLVMAPLEIIDYVIVHELCHLSEMNHSRKFWANVEAIMPEYKIRRNWLKENGEKLKLT